MAQNVQDYELARLGAVKILLQLAKYSQAEELDDLGGVIDDLVLCLKRDAPRGKALRGKGDRSLDIHLEIRSLAALALARLAWINPNPKVAEKIVNDKVLPLLVDSLVQSMLVHEFDKGAALALGSVAQRSPDLAQKVMEAGALDVLETGFKVCKDSDVQKCTAGAMYCIALHNISALKTYAQSGGLAFMQEKFPKSKGDMSAEWFAFRDMIFAQKDFVGIPSRNKRFLSDGPFDEGSISGSELSVDEGASE